MDNTAFVFWPKSQAMDSVIIGSLFALAWTSGVKQNVCCVKNPMSGLLSARVIFMTWQTPPLKYLKLECSCSRWVTLHLYVWQYIQVWVNSCTHYPLSQSGEPQSFSWRTLTNNIPSSADLAILKSISPVTQERDSPLLKQKSQKYC